jgi:hypothetical protein
VLQQRALRHLLLWHPVLFEQQQEQAPAMQSKAHCVHQCLQQQQHS